MPRHLPLRARVRLSLEPLEVRRLLTTFAGANIFYNDSWFDGNDTAANAADDNAIAPDKSPFFASVLFDVQQLTNNLTSDSNPRVYGDKVVWQGTGGTDGGTDDEIFYFDGNTVIQLTENSVPDRNPEISELGIVWERGSGATQEIIFWNGTETQLTSNAVFDGESSLSNDRVSWQQGTGTGLEIWSWDGVSPPANISNNAVVDVQSYADGNQVIWVTDSVPNRKVLRYDGVSTTILGTSEYSIEDPRSDGVFAAWEGFKAGTTNDREIYFYNGVILSRLTTNTFGDFDPQISDGNVAWWGGIFNDFQISLYDGNTVREISTGIRNQFPQLDGSSVVWQGFDGQDDEIFLWDGYKVTQLTDNTVNDTRPFISGNHIVWQAAASGVGTSQEIMHAYFTHETAGVANITSYSRGINGIMVDLADLPAEAVLTADDFRFRVGANNTPESWADAPAPTSVTMRPGEGQGGSTRVTIIWNNGAIKNTWLEVVVEGNDSTGEFNLNTGLAASEIFYFGNRIGDTFIDSPPTVAATTAADELAARFNPGFNQPLTNPYDFDRNRAVNAGDQLIARNNTGLLIKLDLRSPAEVAAENLAAAAIRDDSGVAFALAIAANAAEDADALLPASVTNWRPARFRR